MKEKRQWGYIFSFIVFLFLLVPGSQANAEGLARDKKLSEYKYQYKAPEGFLMLSDTPVWDESKLKELYQGLKPAILGDEVKIIKRIYLTKDKHPKNISGNADLGYWFKNQNEPKSVNSTGDLELYDVENTNMDYLLYVLYHEYGHFFTYYWTVNAEHKFVNDATTKWASMRKLDNYPIPWFKSNVPYNYDWAPAEIQADDFTILFAPQDQKEQWKGYLINMDLPSPENTGIKEYWLSVSKPKPTPTPAPKPEVKPTPTPPKKPAPKPQPPKNPVPTKPTPKPPVKKPVPPKNPAPKQ